LEGGAIQRAKRKKRKIDRNLAKRDVDGVRNAKLCGVAKAGKLVRSRKKGRGKENCVRGSVWKKTTNGVAWAKIAEDSQGRVSHCMSHAEKP